KAALLREDARSPSNVKQEPRLEYVTITTPGGTVLKKFRFEHDYFNAPPNGRLRLKNVFEEDASGNSLPPWSFTYDSQTLPATSSFSQDHWGYYNGKTNSSLAPQVTLPSGSVWPGADRNVDPAKSKAGMLTRITYPTGGYTDFVWESNDYGNINGWQSTMYELGPPKFAQVSSSGGQGSVTQGFTIGGGQPVTATVNVQIYPEACDPGEIIGCENTASIIGKSTWYVNTSEQVTLSPANYTLEANAATSNG